MPRTAIWNRSGPETPRTHHAILALLPRGRQALSKDLPLFPPVNLPNWITLGRIGLTAVFVIGVTIATPLGYLVGLVAFILATISDRLVFGGFLSFDLPPGKHAIHAKRKSSGEGVMAVLSMGATAIASAAIDDDEAQFVFTASPGQVTYLMLEDRQIERRYECQEEDDTARICTKMVFAPQFSVVASNKAVRDLRDLVEIDE